MNRRDANANKSADQKFVGIRLDPERADELKAMADARGMSLNQFVAAILNGSDDMANAVNMTATVRQVRKSLDVQNASGDDLQSKLQRLHALVSVREQLEKKRDALNKEKPADGPITSIFNAAELQEWRRKAKELEDKVHKIVAKIESLEDELVNQETTAGGDADNDCEADNSVAAAATPGKAKQNSEKPRKQTFFERAGLA